MNSPDQLVSQFVEQWRGGTAPDVEEYVDAVAPASKTDLLFQLVALDLQFRSSQGEDVDFATYVDRFPSLLDDEGNWQDEFTQTWEEVQRRAPALMVTEQPVSSQSDPMIGLQVAGYRIVDQLGVGGMGTVWRAVQESTRREVALKCLSERMFDTPRALTLFEREVELAAMLEHPNIARVYDSGVSDGVFFYAMELLDGQELDAFVEQRELPVEEILALMVKVCAAVEAAHQRGIIHRDLKPGNIIVTADGEPHVLDFGLAKSITEEERNQMQTRDGIISGTPAFMAPEQAAGKAREMDTRTDVYALGAILYQLLTGQLPHAMTGGQFAILNRIANEEIIPPRTVRPNLDGELESIMVKALSSSRDDRYASAGQMGGDLACFLAGDPISAHPVTVFYLLRKRIHKHRIPVAVSLAACMLLAAFLFVLSFERKRSRALLSKQSEHVDDAVQAAAEAKGVAAEAQSRERKAQFVANTAHFDALLSLAETAYRSHESNTVYDALYQIPPEYRKESWNYLRDRIDPQVRYFAQAPTNQTYLFAIPGALREFIVILDGEFGVFSFYSNRVVRVFNTQIRSPNAWTLSKDGNRFALASNQQEEKVFQVFDVESGRLVSSGKWKRKRESQSISAKFPPLRFSLNWDGQYLMWWGRDSLLRIFDASTGLLRWDNPKLPQARWNRHANAIHGVRHNGKFPVVGTFYLRTGRYGRELRILNTDKIPSVMTSVSSDGKWFAAADGKQVYSIGLKSPQQYVIKPFTVALRSIVHVDGSRLMMIGDDGHGSVGKLWNPGSSTVERLYPGLSGADRSEGDLLHSGIASTTRLHTNRARFYRLPIPRPSTRIEPNSAWYIPRTVNQGVDFNWLANGLLFKKDSFGFGETANPERGLPQFSQVHRSGSKWTETRGVFPLDGRDTVRLEFSSDEKLCVIGRNDRHFVRANTGEVLPVHMKPLLVCTNFSRSSINGGRSLFQPVDLGLTQSGFVEGEEDYLRVRAVTFGSLNRSFAVQFDHTPPGRAGRYGWLFFDVLPGAIRQRHLFNCGKSRVSAASQVKFADQDSKFVALTTGTSRNSNWGLSLYDAKTNVEMQSREVLPPASVERVQQLREQLREIWDCNKDGKVFALVQDERNVELFSGVTLQPIGSYRCHDDLITGVTFHPRLPLFATASMDLTIRIWDYKGELRKEVLGLSAVPTFVHFSPDGTQIACAQRGAPILVWDVKNLN